MDYKTRVIDIVRYFNISSVDCVSREEVLNGGLSNLRSRIIYEDFRLEDLLEI